MTRLRTWLHRPWPEAWIGDSRAVAFIVIVGVIAGIVADCCGGRG